MWRVGAVDLAWGGSDRRERTRKEVRGGGGQPGFRDLVVGDPDEDTAGTIHATTTVDEVARVPIPVLPSQPPSFQRRRSVKPVQGHERPSVHEPYILAVTIRPSAVDRSGPSWSAYQARVESCEEFVACSCGRYAVPGTRLARVAASSR